MFHLNKTCNSNMILSGLEEHDFLKKLSKDEEKNNDTQ